MVRLDPGWLPASVGILFAIGAITAYATSVVKEEVTPYVPFVSEAGTFLPQSGLFSIFLFLTSLTCMVTVCVMYTIIKGMLEPKNRMDLVINLLGLISGLVSAFGLIVVASYPLSSTKIAHDIGAVMTFVMGVLYTCFQTYLSYKIYPGVSRNALCRFRLFLSLIGVISIATMFVFNIIGTRQWYSVPHEYDKAKRLYTDEGFVALTVAASAEWIVCFCFMSFFFTYVVEFQRTHRDERSYYLVNLREFPSEKSDSKPGQDSIVRV